MSGDVKKSSPANLPSFSFVRGRFVSAGKYLVGVELFESEVSELSSLRQDSVRKTLERTGFLEPETGHVSSVRQPKGVEGRETIYAPRRSAAVPVSRLLLSIFAMVTALYTSPFFFLYNRLLLVLWEGVSMKIYSDDPNLRAILGNRLSRICLLGFAAFGCSPFSPQASQTRTVSPN